MAAFRCGICGSEHDHLLLDLAFRRPAHFLAIPPEERERRTRCSDDLCVVDGEHFLIRGVLELPITGTTKRFGWGVWALVAREDFYRYVDAWRMDIEAEVPPFPGRLSGGMSAYPDSDGLEIMVQLRSGGSRPSFTVRSETHPLGVDQCQGITMAKVHSFVAPFSAL